MAKPPPVRELEFLQLVSNHAELVTRLERLAVPGGDITRYARHVAQCWFRLGVAHAQEAQLALTAGCERAVLSRSYYAAYNASKAVRYMTHGFVSLKGDDHRHASSLPHDLPDYDSWGRKITDLYEHRLRADYDNWSSTAAENTITPVNALATAVSFLDVAKKYLRTKYGVPL